MSESHMRPGWSRVAMACLIAPALLLAACGGDDETGTDAAATPVESAQPTPSEIPSSPSESVVASPSEGGAEGESGDVAALVEELESCLKDGGIETKTEMPPELPIWGEEAVIALTFEYDALTVPDAVTLYVFPSEDAAAKAKKQIDKDLLEGDSETLLRGQVVVDDFGTTLDAPEAADQAQVVESCTA